MSSGQGKPLQPQEAKLLYWDEFNEYCEKDLAHIKEVHERTKAEDPNGIGTIWTPTYWPNDNGFYRWYLKYKAGAVQTRPSKPPIDITRAKLNKRSLE